MHRCTNIILNQNLYTRTPQGIREDVRRCRTINVCGNKTDILLREVMAGNDHVAPSYAKTRYFQHVADSLYGNGDFVVHRMAGVIGIGTNVSGKNSI